MRRGLAAALGALVLLAACEPRPPTPPPEPKLVLAPARFEDLPGWQTDEVAEAWPALERSCRAIERRPPDTAQPHGLTAGDWQRACTALAAAGAGQPPDSATLRQAIEATFRPYSATADGEPEGLFTGYFEIELAGSRARDGANAYPLYRRPPDLVTVDLGEFRDGLKGQRIAGRVAGGALKPYPDRAAIDRGALAGQGLELAWVADPVDAFFLHIQGSGRVRLSDGGTLRVGYAAQNGHPYLAIGKPLIERGAIPAERVSMQAIRAWLDANRDEAERIMWLNASYVFFREIDGEGPIGAQGVALTPARSIAVDPRFVGMGTPVWLDASAPAAEPGAPDRPLRRMLVAQDTGGAIRGPVRGDVFWGHGQAAAEIAGRMKQRGRWWLLLPRDAPALQAAARQAANRAPLRRS